MLEQPNIEEHGAGRSGCATGRTRPIEINVNENPVNVIGQKQTGGSIKDAAIDQGVQIEPDFVLSIERGQGQTQIVGDDDDIRVNKNSRFLAIAPDDNS